jgi:hypothetical protein
LGSIGASADQLPPDPAPAPADPTPTPISKEEFQRKLSRWSYINFAQIGPIKEATIHDRETGEVWRVEEGDSIEDLQVLGIGGTGLTVSVGGRKGKLELISDPAEISILEDAFGAYTWNNEVGPPEILQDPRFCGKVAFRSTGNNRLEIRRVNSPKVGTSPETWCRLNVALYLTEPTSDILIQAQGSSTSWTRWAFDAEKTYQGGYPWPPAGTTTGLAIRRWHYVSIDLIENLGIKEGEEITELAFSAYGKDVVFDSVSFSRVVPSGAKAVK